MTDSKPDLAAVLEHYGVDIANYGGNRLVLCPVHSEDVPSCSVHLDKGLMHCFSCGFRGDSISLIREKEHLDYPAAIAFAEAHLGFAPRAPAQRGRVGLSGEARPARGGYQPRVRRRAGLGRS